MALAAVQSATCFQGRPVGRRLLAAGRFAAVPAASASRAWAARVTRGIRVQAGGASDNRPPADKSAGTPPWERQQEDDGLDPVRERMRQYTLAREREGPLMPVLKKLKAEERQWLEYFALAEQRGDEAHMEALSTQWKLSIEKMELLKKDPQEFVRRWGPSYKLSVEDVRGAVAGQSKDTQESRGPPSFFTDLWIFIQRVNYFLYVCLILWGVYLLLSE